MSAEYWGLSLDDLAERIYELRSDAIGAHHIAFEGDRAGARAKLIAAFTELIDREMYRANAYGARWQAGGDDAA